MEPPAQDALLTALEHGDTRPSALSARERALLDYAERLTSDPASIGAGDIAKLRDAGLDDVAIHDACAIVSYFAFVNRIADGLGVELETGGTAP
ncbi:MAG: hypothetical protein O2973_08320 [Gemmatimonadetes bacterium]|nr:hypothetical protein [Gemmatimonadota bacterium]